MSKQKSSSDTLLETPKLSRWEINWETKFMIGMDVKFFYPLFTSGKHWLGDGVADEQNRISDDSLCPVWRHPKGQLDYSYSAPT